MTPTLAAMVRRIAWLLVVGAALGALTLLLLPTPAPPVYEPPPVTPLPTATLAAPTLTPVLLVTPPPFFSVIAVATRAPLPIDPARLGSGRNWFQTGMLAVVAALILLAYASHLDEGLIDRIDWRWVFAAMPLAWGLHFAAKCYDRRIRILRR